MRDRVRILGFALAVLAAWALPSPAQEETEYLGGRPVAARQVLVKFRSLGPLTLSQMRKAYDLDRAHGIGGTGVYLLRSRSRSAQALLLSLSVRKHIGYAEPDYILRAAELPNDPEFGNQWALLNVGQSILNSPGTPGADIGAVFAWDLSTGWTSNTVAILDTGVDYGHPDLAANLWSAPSPFSIRLGNRVIACPAGSHGYDAVRNTCNPWDDNRHGTHLAGIIGAVGNNGQGVSGVNWTTSILAVKFLNAKGAGTTSNAIDAIEFAIQAKKMGLANVRVMTNAWGGNINSKALMEAVGRALENGILFVAAAGNTATNNDVSPFYPASYPLPNVISVTATDHHDGLLPSANVGANSVHLGAPGGFILSSVPGGRHDYSSGTSMAAAYAAGAATLMFTVCHELNAQDARSILLQAAQGTAALAGKTITGGRLNVDRAIQACNVPAFAISGAPATATAAQGGSASYSLQVIPTGGFFGSVSLDVQGLPAGASFTFSSSAVGPPAAVNLTVSPSSSVGVGTYMLTVTGTSEGMVRTALLWLTVTRGNRTDRTN